MERPNETYEELEQALTKVNVTLKTSTGEFRSAYDIIADLAMVWGRTVSEYCPIRDDR